ncbi:hypothetical protein KAU25_06110, partial [Candidatus Bathyarchaeota archaeon]|nr:hypothetical protein [Candidatus Bathyarchaeota archaeon]
ILLMCLLPLVYSVAVVRADYYYFFLVVTVEPEFPTSQDHVNVTVSFEVASISYYVNFSTLTYVEHNFSLTIDIYVPPLAFPTIGFEEETYVLGELSTGLYSFNVAIQVWEIDGGSLLESTSYSRTFIVQWNPADVNLDFEVNIFDAVLFCDAYGSTSTEPNWNPHCDLVEPFGIIDMLDVVLMADSYGEEYHGP